MKLKKNSVQLLIIPHQKGGGGLSDIRVQMKRDREAGSMERINESGVEIKAGWPAHM